MFLKRYLWLFVFSIPIFSSGFLCPSIRYLWGISVTSCLFRSLYSLLTTYQTISHQLEISNKYRHQFSGLIKNLNPREHKFPQNVKTEIQRSFVFFKMLQKISKSWDPQLNWNYYLNILLRICCPKGIGLERIYKPHYDYQTFSPLANGTDLNRQKYAILQTHWH